MSVASTGAGAQTGGTKMLLVDLRGGLLLLNEARCRTVERVFGVRRDQVNLTTVIALLLVAESIQRRTERLKPAGARRLPTTRSAPARSGNRSTASPAPPPATRRWWGR